MVDSKLEIIELNNVVALACKDCDIDITESKSDQLTKRVCDLIGLQLAANRKIRKVGFGTFEPKAMAERLISNPQHPGDVSKRILVPAHISVKFGAGAKLKAVVNSQDQSVDQG